MPEKRSCRLCEPRDVRDGASRENMTALSSKCQLLAWWMELNERFSTNSHWIWLGPSEITLAASDLHEQTVYPVATAARARTGENSPSPLHRVLGHRGYIAPGATHKGTEGCAGECLIHSVYAPSLGALGDRREWRAGTLVVKVWVGAARSATGCSFHVQAITTLPGGIRLKPGNADSRNVLMKFGVFSSN